MISEKVKRSAKFIVDNSNYVSINFHKLDECSEWLYKHRKFDIFAESSNHPTQLDHLDIETYLFFTFATDAMNFCFWPFNKEYEDLTAFLKSNIKSGRISVVKIAEMSFEEFSSIFKNLFNPDPYNQLEERYRILQELSQVVLENYKGSFKNIIIESEMDANKLLKIVTQKMTSFQDHCIYKGRQVFFYKRAQILVGDVHETLKTIASYKDELSDEDKQFVNSYHLHKGLLNIDSLTCFADYRVPQVLHILGFIQYKDSLLSKIESKEILQTGSEEECEIRAAMIHSIELLKEKTKELYGCELMSIEIDWIMWQYGEKNLKDTYPFHRTVGIFY